MYFSLNGTCWGMGWAYFSSMKRFFWFGKTGLKLKKVNNG
jgi:hypothetical protein